MAKPKEETKTVSQPKKKISPARIPPPVRAYTRNIGKGRAPTLEWEAPEWDLAECGRILDTESYVRRAFRNKKNLFLKEGYSFIGADPERIRYIESRIHQMEEKTGIPFPMLLSTLIWSLIRSNNAFLIKVRKTELSGGQERTVLGRTIKPVAAYFPFPAETIRFRRDENGTIKGYKQVIRGKEDKEFPPEDVIHFHFDKREGFSIGTPGIVSVKDDIRALRRIEENVELLVYQHLFPLFHYQVGTEEAPAETYSDGRTEVEVIKMSVEAMPTDGCWVTPERHKITVLGAEGNALAVDKVIAHFKQRIFTGLGQSSVDMGEGGTASRSTASTMSRNLVDDTKEDQREFGAQFYSYVIQELLLESTFDQETIFDEDNKVFLKFNEIDLEHRISKANHYTDLFLKNAITHDELRIAIGMKPFEGEGWPTSTDKKVMTTKGDGDWARTNYGIIERDKIILQSIDEPGTDEARALAETTGQKNSQTGEAAVRKAKASEAAVTIKVKGPAAENAAISGNNRPSNQHGTRNGPKLNKDEFSFADKRPELQLIYKQGMPLSSIMAQLAKDVNENIRRKGVSIRELDSLLNIAFTNARDRLISLARRAYRIGLEESGSSIFQVNGSDADGKIQRHIERFVYNLKEEVLSVVDRKTKKTKETINEDALIAEIGISFFNYRARMIDDSEIMRAYNYGLASGFKAIGVQNISIDHSQDECCETCKKHSLNYDYSNAIIYEDLPPLHPHCECKMKRS